VPELVHPIFATSATRLNRYIATADQYSVSLPVETGGPLLAPGLAVGVAIGASVVTCAPPIAGHSKLGVGVGVVLNPGLRER